MALEDGEEEDDVAEGEDGEASEDGEDGEDGEESWMLCTRTRSISFCMIYIALVGRLGVTSPRCRVFMQAPLISQNRF